MRPTLFRLMILNCILAGAAVMTSAQLPTQVAQNSVAVRQTPEPEKAENAPYTGPLTRPSDLTRVGVQQAQPLPLSLQEAIRRALENNNDIEISRGDVR